jgi:steroid 5-alpha reductase family enzyme
MLKTIFLLIATLVVLPLVAFYYDEPLSAVQRDMLHTATLMMLVVAAYCFIVGEITRNNSQVDKLWSIVPIFYTGYFAWASGWNPRVTLMACLATVWAIRLTYNFSRRGAYSWKFWSGEEDYRWQVLRQEPMFNTRLKWAAFNLFFISLYQNALILFFTLPALMVVGSDKPLGVLDYILAGLMLAAIALEYVADEQQWQYQEEKKRRLQSGVQLEPPYSDGFVSSGLWQYVRHPNYSAEQATWILFYGFSIAATGKWLNWSAAGCVLLLLLFQGSADFSERISASKYSGYADYQRKTGRFLPRWK